LTHQTRSLYHAHPHIDWMWQVPVMPRCYVPMIELLRANGFATYIASGGTVILCARSRKSFTRFRRNG